MSNFQFLESHWTDLAKLGDLSEKYVYSDPNTSIIKQGMLSEVMVKYMLAYDGIAEPAYDNTHANRIRILKNNDLLPREIDNTLYILRKSRNDAAHNAADEGEKALNNLQLMYELCVWYMQTYGDYNYEPTGYVQPVDMTVCLADLEKENAELEERNQQLLIEIEQIQKNGRADSKRRTVAYQKALNVHLSEAQTRELIDEQLRKVGWEANTTELRYSNGTRPTKGKNLAIAEWPTDSNTGNNGYADYALFIGEKLVGIVEAKKKHTNISSVLDGQCKDYAKMIKSEHQKYVINRFGAYMVPFLYATNGRPYIKQYEQMSGIWCLDVREPFNAPKALSGWSTPEGIEQALEKDIVEADKKLAATGYEVLQDPDGLNLRYYQIEAIQAAEKAIAEHKQTALLAMATGTGKTRTVLGMIYRFLDAGRFKRILYLVDRTSLGDQTMDTFKEVKLKELLTLNQMYDVKSLEDKEFEKDTRVHIATVQSLVKRIMYNESDKSLGVSDYDMVIVDEAHRGYILDKEMGDDEILYRDQNDFRSKYRAVIDYFDAVKIALTATPALHTTEIFGKPVYVLEAAKGKDVDIVLDMNGYKWTINGNNIQADNLKDINLAVDTDSDAIPDDVISELAGNNPVKQISLAYSGDFGFKASLTYNIGSEYAGKYGNLYYYDSTGRMIFQNAGAIDADGNISLNFSHASEYAVVIADYAVTTENADNTATGGIATGDSTPIALYAVLCVMAIALAGIAAVTRKKNV